MVDAEYPGFNQFALRVGYSYNTSPISSRDVTLNILAPAVMQHHISGGLSYYVTPSSSIDLAAVVSPQGVVSGIERTPLAQTRCARSISISTHSRSPPDGLIASTPRRRR